MIRPIQIYPATHHTPLGHKILSGCNLYHLFNTVPLLTTKAFCRSKFSNPHLFVV